ncbi:flagellar protein FlaG [Pseudomonas boanensis]|uniref:flagellar protein FlaG n=1 Tax=Metapseudomonas boanensis TaxID=2822138 RepID=UPI0035D4978F
MDVTKLNAQSQSGVQLRHVQGGDPLRPVRNESVTELQPQKSQGEGEKPEQGEQPVEAALSNIQDFVQNIQRNLSFALDDSSGRVVVKVTDAASGEVIRQIPSEDVLKLAESLSEARSLLFQAEA